ncbi:hypothetical protein Pa4123_06470 [Phytohabitans aurantiacus]|jgi:hypothetical protein|uniref:Uncharacterized protein n=2 Tax=Phytohabitans aurantiacus TaxID=3016789 RepID=A0ABQ5QM84_9ACTN|nr:hypothetical protein Pa4123_06470 [Phytohabitans aurantiacus]
MDPFQAELARIALETVGNRGFVLGGGHAVQLHGMAERLSEDIDAASRGMSGLPNDFFASAAGALAGQGHVGAPDVLGPVLKAFFQ